MLRVEPARTEDRGKFIPPILAGREAGAFGEFGPIEGLRAVEAVSVDLEVDALVDDDRDHLASGDVAELGGDAGEGTRLAQRLLQLDFSATELGHVERFPELHILEFLAAEPRGVSAHDAVAADVFDTLEDRAGFDGDDDIDLTGLRIEDRLDRGLGEATGGV